MLCELCQEKLIVDVIFKMVQCDVVQSLEGDNLGGDASSRIYETVRSEVRRAIADIQNDLESVSCDILILSS